MNNRIKNILLERARLMDTGGYIKNSTRTLYDKVTDELTKKGDIKRTSLGNLTAASKKLISDEVYRIVNDPNYDKKLYRNPRIPKSQRKPRKNPEKYIGATEALENWRYFYNEFRNMGYSVKDSRYAASETYAKAKKMLKKQTYLAV